MDSKKKRKLAPSSSSESSSSSSAEVRRKQKHRNLRKQQRESSSSSDEEAVRKAHKHQAHKKSATRKHSHSAKTRAKLAQSSAKKAPRSMSPASRAAHKHLKAKMAAKKAKLAQLEEHERHSRTPTRRDVKKDRTPDHRMASPTTRIRVSVPNNRAVRERSTGRGIKDSPSSIRRHREPAGDEERAEILARCQERARERDRLKRMQEEEERYKHGIPRSSERTRMIPGPSILPEKHRHERSRSPSRGKIPIRDRLDKEYEYRRSISREHEEYPMIRGSGPSREVINPYGRERPIPREEPERKFDYRSDDRRVAGHDYPSRPFEERHHHRPQNWEAEREIEPRSSRMYENRDWEPASHPPKRIPEEPFKDPRDRAWNDQPHDKWTKEKDPKEWSRSWKEPSGSHHGPPSSSGPSMPHPRRWPGPSPSEPWTPRGPHPSSHKMDHPSGSGPPFKPRFPGSSTSPHFGGFKRFPFRRYHNQFSKINYPSKRILPSGLSSTTSPGMPLDRTPIKAENLADSPMKSDLEQLPSTPGKVEATESGELIIEPEEDKVEADTTFSGNVDTQSQEECEGNLSEFSDVDDEILNREEVSCRRVAPLVGNQNFVFLSPFSLLFKLLQKIEDASARMGVRASSSLRLPSNAHVNNRNFSPFSSDYYCIYGLLPRHSEDDGRRVRLHPMSFNLVMLF